MVPLTQIEKYVMKTLMMMKWHMLPTATLLTALGMTAALGNDKLPDAPKPSQPPLAPIVPTPGNPYNYPPLNGPGVMLPTLPGLPTLTPSFPPIGPPGGGIIVRYPF